MSSILQAQRDILHVAITAFIFIGVIWRIIVKFFFRTFEAGFRAGFCHFLRRIAALFYNKNGGNMPEWCHKELLKKF